MRERANIQNIWIIQEANLKKSKQHNQAMGYRTRQIIHKRGLSNGWQALKDVQVLSDEEMQIKTILRFHHTSIRIAESKNSDDNRCYWGCGERGTILHCWWNWPLVPTFWKSIWRFLRKPEIDVPENPAVPLLGTDQKGALLCYRCRCSTMFIAALFVKARSWKHPDVSNQKNIEKIWFTFAVECYSAIKNENIRSFWVNE